MNKLFFLIPAFTICFFSFGQQKNKNKKYPSLFWEITGNGLKKPSYLFGTMHVSSKIAFNLSDSFYLAIKNSEVVALENNPESWQEDMDKYESNNEYDYVNYQDGLNGEMPAGFFNISSLRIEKYESNLEMALFMKPAVINNLLYRSYSDYGSDFEEDTYLDLYIFQTGKRMGKRVAGVEKYAESMRLMNEAFKDAAKEKNKKEKSFDYDEEYAPAKLQEAYRSGNLDLLDSVNRFNSQSEAFDEKFLYKRNEIQANSIDSILKKYSLFVGVGAAHLPGNRGVIEMLRKKGYQLRPIFMGARDSRHKEEIEKIRVPVIFSTQTSDDGFFKADIPGKFYSNKNALIDLLQYADMANGSFYMVTRVKTNSLFWGHGVDEVAKKIDSVLYENIPGKILTKSEISKNGYRGYDISNRTRRGDFHRYNIFITPFEVLFFRMGGIGDYVKNGDEAKKFFGSIQLKELKNGGWKKFQPSFGGFSVYLPQEPDVKINHPVQFDAEEKSTGTHFSILRTDIHNYNFAEEDSFDLNLMDESFASSEFIEKTIDRKQNMFKGFPALDCHYLHKDGSVFVNRYIIQGPHYYALIAHGKKENESMNRFFNSFEIKPFLYKDASEKKDTSLYYTVSTSWFPESKKEKTELANENTYDDEEDTDYEYYDARNYKTRLIKNDTTGEAIFISFYKSPKYFYSKDSSVLNEKSERIFYGDDSSWIVRNNKRTVMPGKPMLMEAMLSDTGSSRAIWTKSFYKNGVGYSLMAQTDTLLSSGNFIKNFFATFSPADTVKGYNPFIKKSKIYFDDFFSADSVIKNKAIRSISQVEFDSTDLPMMDKAIHSFTWNDKKYLDRKVTFINKLGAIPDKKSSDLLKQFYYEAGDTVQLQNAALESLLKNKTQYAFNIFKDIITTEPPVLDMGISNYNYLSLSGFNKANNYLPDINNGNFLDELYDSLLLTKTILPELLPLMNLDDYKWPVMRLLKIMVDSNLVQPKEYEIYFSKFLLEAKQAVKKQSIEEKKSAIEKAEEEKKETKSYNFYNKDESDKGNEKLIAYATLLLPFQNTKPGVDAVINQLLSSGDKRLKYNTAYLLLRNKKSFPDSLLTYFAGIDEYRYELYSDLNELKMLNKFPASFNNHQDLARSKLISSLGNSKPDSLIFLDSLTAADNKKSGLVFFYKYKLKKDDVFWKLATVGLIPPDANEFLFKDEKEKSNYSTMPANYKSYYKKSNQFAFTKFTDVKIKEDEPLREQFNKQLKKMLYSKRKSGRMFYEEVRDRYNTTTMFR